MYVAPNVVKNGYPVAVGASESNYVISEVIKLSPEDRLGLAAFVKPSAVTGTVEVDLQHSPDGTNHWAAVNTTDCRLTFSGTTGQRLFVNTLNTNSKSYLPLFPFVRFVATTGVGEAVTISDIHLTYTQQ